MNTPIILEEINDQDYVPTQDELNEYAISIGIDLEKEPDLRKIALNGIKAPLPSNWKCILDPTGYVYFFNCQNGESSWNHPLDKYFRGVAISERYQMKNQLTKPKLIPRPVVNEKTAEMVAQDECISEEDSGCSNVSDLRLSFYKHRANQANKQQEEIIKEDIGNLNHNSEVELFSKFIAVTNKNTNNNTTRSLKKIKMKNSTHRYESDIDITKTDGDFEMLRSDASIDLTISHPTDTNKNTTLNRLEVHKLKIKCEELETQAMQREKDFERLIKSYIEMIERQNKEIALLKAQINDVIFVKLKEEVNKPIGFIDSSSEEEDAELTLNSSKRKKNRRKRSRSLHPSFIALKPSKSNKIYYKADTPAISPTFNQEVSLD